MTAVLLVNNTTDCTIARIHSVALAMTMTVQVHEVVLPPGLANAGNARRLCMDMAAAEAPDAVLLTTDADAVPRPDFIAAAVAGLRSADLVCGAIRVRDLNHWLTPAALHAARTEARYTHLMHEVRCDIDRLQGRLAADALRPHYMESGAALALTARSYDALGGLPAVASSEDRALVHRAEQCGLRVTYSSAMQTWVSARLDGRAENGMSACIRARQHEADPWADQAMMRPADIAALWRAAKAGGKDPFPDRSVPFGQRLRISDLEAGMPDLARFVGQTVLMGRGLANAG